MDYKLTKRKKFWIHGAEYIIRQLANCLFIDYPKYKVVLFPIMFER